MHFLYKPHGYMMLLMISILYFLQMQMIFNADVASLLYDTQLFLSGGTYVKDFFETNPPMIFILYTPIIILQKLTAWNIKSLSCLYFIFLGFISLIFCRSFIKIVLPVEDHYLQNAILLMLVYLFFIAPMGDFGQREHLLLMLSMPYLLATVVRAKNISIPIMKAGFVGILAGLVFSLKPFFLVPLMLTECYLMVVKKNFWSWIRTECLILLLVILMYAGYFYYYHALYFDVLIPLLSQFYLPAIKESWLCIFSKPRVIFCSLIIIYYLFFYQKNKFRELSSVLFFSLVGFMFVFIFPRASWNYHVLPAYYVALLLGLIFVYTLWEKDIKQKLLNKQEAFFIIIASFAMPIVIHVNEVRHVIEINQSKYRIALYEKVKTIAHQSIYCFSAITTGLCFPLATESNLQFAGRYPLFWWLRELRKMELKYNDHLPDEVVRHKNYFIDTVAYDLNHYKPELVITYKWDEQFLPKGYSYPTYFSTRESFKNAWLPYQLVDDEGPYRLYRRKYD